MSSAAYVARLEDELHGVRAERDELRTELAGVREEHSRCAGVLDATAKDLAGALEERDALARALEAADRLRAAVRASGMVSADAEAYDTAREAVRRGEK